MYQYITYNFVGEGGNEILNELGDLATVVSRNYVYGKIKDKTGLSIRHISRIINHTKVEEI